MLWKGLGELEGRSEGTDCDRSSHITWRVPQVAEMAMQITKTAVRIQ